MSNRSRNGSAVVIAIVTLLVMLMIFISITRTVVLRATHSDHIHWRAQAEWLAQGALTRAAQTLADNPTYSGEEWTVTFNHVALKNGRATITVSPRESDHARDVTIVAIVPNDPKLRSQVTLQTRIDLTSSDDEPTPSTDSTE